MDRVAAGVQGTSRRGGGAGAFGWLRGGVGSDLLGISVGLILGGGGGGGLGGAIAIGHLVRRLRRQGDTVRCYIAQTCLSWRMGGIGAGSRV